MKRVLGLLCALTLAACAPDPPEVAATPADPEAEFVQARLARQPVVQPAASAADPFTAPEPVPAEVVVEAPEVILEDPPPPVEAAPPPPAKPATQAPPVAKPKPEPNSEVAPQPQPEAKPKPAAKPKPEPKPEPKVVEKPAAPAPTPKPKPKRTEWQAPPKQAGGTVVVAKIETVSTVPDPASVPYKECLIYLKYQVVKVESGSYEGDGLLAVHWGMKDGKRAPAAGYRPGQQQRLTIEPLDKHPELSRVMQADDTGEYDLTPYYVVKVE